MTDWNANIIQEFRENEGRVGGYFDGATMLLLHTTGRRTGEEHVNPLVYLPDDGRWVVVGSKGARRPTPTGCATSRRTRTRRSRSGPRRFPSV